MKNRIFFLTSGFIFYMEIADEMDTLNLLCFWYRPRRF